VDSLASDVGVGIMLMGRGCSLGCVPVLMSGGVVVRNERILKKPVPDRDIVARVE